MSNEKSRFIWIRAAAFLLLAGFVLACLTKIFVPKYYAKEEWPSTASSANFYHMEKDTIDVLFLGNSKALTCFSPQELYNAYGITSYNLASEQQSMIISYYWLKEALRFQSPKAVVLDTRRMFVNDERVLSMNEPLVRKSMDFMKWSSVKAEAVERICSIDKSQSKFSWYFPLYRYHARWKELEEDDFDYMFGSRDGEFKGYNMLTRRVGVEFTPLEIGTSDKKAKMNQEMLVYMDGIVNLCRENNIQLILVDTPYLQRNARRHNVMAAYAKENGVPYYDMNIKENYEKIGVEFAEDYVDSKHANVWGAEKVTKYIGGVLSEEYGITPRKDAQYEETSAFYELRKKDCMLTTVTDISEYLPLLSDERYSIFLAVKGDAGGAVTEDILGMLRQLGIAIPLENTENASYYAVIDGEYRVEEISEKSLSAVGSLRNGIEAYQITSEGKDCGNSAAITIGGNDYAMDINGLNIVVYNHEIRKVVDSVCFDTGSPEFTAYR